MNTDIENERINNSDSPNRTAVTTQMLRRIPYYLRYLREVNSLGVHTVSAPEIAMTLQLNEVQVRKDLALVSSEKGRPKVGFSVSILIDGMEDLLGCRTTTDAVLVGVGSLGRALLSYRGFDKYGLRIAAAFDIDKQIIGSTVDRVQICHVDKLEEICQKLNVSIGIITSPTAQAQNVCDRLVASGIKAIWNFAPCHLSVPEDVLIQHENMAGSLAVLSTQLRAKHK